MLFLNEYNIMRIVLFHNFKKKMSEAAIRRCLSETDALPNLILDFDNKLMKGIKRFRKFLEDTTKVVRFLYIY